MVTMTHCGKVVNKTPLTRNRNTLQVKRSCPGVEGHGTIGCVPCRAIEKVSADHDASSAFPSFTVNGGNIIGVLCKPFKLYKVQYRYTRDNFPFILRYNVLACRNEQRQGWWIVIIEGVFSHCKNINSMWKANLFYKKTSVVEFILVVLTFGTPGTT